MASLLWLAGKKRLAIERTNERKKNDIKSVYIHMCHSINIIPKPFRLSWKYMMCMYILLLGLNPIAHSNAEKNTIIPYALPYNRLCMFEVQLLSKVILFTLVSRWLNIRFQLSFFILYPLHVVSHLAIPNCVPPLLLLFSFFPPSRYGSITSTIATFTFFNVAIAGTVMNGHV